MKKQIAAVLMAASVLSFSTITMAAVKPIEGTLEKIDGEFYVIKDAAGKEVRAHVTAKTKKEGDIKEGAAVDVTMDKDGNAVKVAEHKK